jgi:hypothetical protein
MFGNMCARQTCANIADLLSHGLLLTARTTSHLFPGAVSMSTGHVVSRTLCRAESLGSGQGS